MSLNIDDSTTIGELVDIPELAEASDLIVAHMPERTRVRPLGNYEGQSKMLVVALEHLAEVLATGNNVIPVYGEDEVAKNPDLAQAKLVRWIERPGAPFVLVCPGGAYTHVNSLIEGFPIAHELSGMGLNSLILTYRTAVPSSAKAALDDVARALRLVDKNAGEWGISLDGYAIMGASAGGHLAGAWSTKGMGYAKYGLPKPAAALLLYPALSCTLYYEGMEQARGVEGAEMLAEGIESYLVQTVGEPLTREACEELSVEAHVDADYPATYLVHALDDPTVPTVMSQILEGKLKDAGVACAASYPATGGHGFGVAYGSEPEGWLPEAVDLWRLAIGR